MRSWVLLSREILQVVTVKNLGDFYASQSRLSRSASLRKRILTNNYFLKSIMTHLHDFGPSNISGCRFDGNTATDGGGIYTAAGYDMVVNSSFTIFFADSFDG